MWKRIYLTNKLRWRVCRSGNTALKTYQQQLLTHLALPLSTMPLMAVDLEMTGLDSRVDQILSIGIVPIIQGMLILEKAQYKLIKIDGSVGQSAAIHGIVDRQLNDALSTEQAMLWFLKQTQGYILLAHHAALDMCFLTHQISRCFAEPICLVCIDTMMVEHRRLLRKNSVFKEGALRLEACRGRYGLPVYAAHNAAVDAISCGELFLAQMAHMGAREDLYLWDFL